jgi:hypothetical protein
MEADMQKWTNMDVHHGHGLWTWISSWIRHATWAWTCRMDMDMQQGHGPFLLGWPYFLFKLNLKEIIEIILST